MRTMKLRKYALRALAAAALLAPAAALECAAQPGSVRIESPGASVAIAFGERHAQGTREYYAPAPEGKPKKEKKAKKEKDLPPGLQKKLARGEPLPPGHAKRILPAELESRLVRLPQGYRRYVVGPDVVIVDTRRNVVIDIVVQVAL